MAAGSFQPVGTISPPMANMRSGPGTGYPVLAQVKQGTVLNIVSRTPGGEWLQVCCVDNQVGWLWAQLLIVEGSIEGLPVLETPGEAPAPTPAATRSVPATFTGWKGEYFANPRLEGVPALVRDDGSIDFHWGGASPGSGIPSTDFSVRWTRRVDFAGGDYTFYAQVDDGVRVYLDGILLIDQWRVGSTTTHQNTFKKLGSGPHTVTVEYFQAQGDAVAVVWWEQVGAAETRAPAVPTSPFPEWKAEYYNDIHLQGDPLLVRNDVQLNFHWSLESPDPRVPSDNWSARWTRSVYLEEGNYQFFAHTRDGVRVYLDGWKVIDEWHDTEGDPTYVGRFDRVGGGVHSLKVEYYARGGIAYAQVWWQQGTGGGGATP